MNTLPAALPTYQINADARHGPAMEALSDMQRQFVFALIQSGCSQSKAAELAGYRGGPNTWKAVGWRLAHDSRVQAAIHEEAQKLIRTTSVMAIKVIEDLASDRKVKPEVRLKAATELLNRSGLHAQTEHKVTVERHLDDQQLVNRIVGLARDLDLDPRQLLGSRGYVVDAEFELIAGPSEAPAALSAVGLEDLLE
jgi:phage terminase small subunit